MFSLLSSPSPPLLVFEFLWMVVEHRRTSPTMIFLLVKAFHLQHFFVLHFSTTKLFFCSASKMWKKQAGGKKKNLLLTNLNPLCGSRGSVPLCGKANEIPLGDKSRPPSWRRPGRALMLPMRGRRLTPPVSAGLKKGL